MSDQVQQSIGDLVLSASPAVWTKIKKVLPVKTREEAATLVESDPKSREAVVAILAGEETLVTGGRSKPSSAVTSARAPSPDLAQQMYGKKPAKVSI